MVIQPCPDCGTLMDDCYDPTDSNQEKCYHCPTCGNTWTMAEILDTYDLYGDGRDETDETKGKESNE